MIPSDLYDAYRNTSYQVFNSDLSIHIGDFHNNLDQLLEDHQCETWAFITASNPRSKTLLEDENLKRHQLLLDDLTAFILFEGQGVGEDPAWKPELSVLVLGIPQELAIEIGKKYDQNAIVTGIKGGVAELTLTAQD